jgi:hypothetical protein
MGTTHPGIKPEYNEAMKTKLGSLPGGSNRLSGEYSLRGYDTQK